MAKVKNGLLGMISGKLGAMVVVTRGKTTYVRSLPDYTDKSWSEKQLQVRKRFRAVSLFSQQHKKSLIWPVWKLIPEDSNGYHRFLGDNIHAFGLDGKVMDLALVRFSAGSLPAAVQVKAERQPGQIRVTWENEPWLDPPRLHDQLWYMVVLKGEKIVGKEFVSPIFDGPHKPTVTRGQQEAVLPDPDGNIIGVYVFFASGDQKAFSGDRYVGVV